MNRQVKLFAALAFVFCLVLGLSACGQGSQPQVSRSDDRASLSASDKMEPSQGASATSAASSSQEASSSASEASSAAGEGQAGREKTAGPSAQSAETMRAQLNIIDDYRESFIHGDKGADFQKYIMLHDTEGDADPRSIVEYWDSNGQFVAAHFVVGKDGSIVQCVPLDNIAHHAGYGDTGHNGLYGVEDESRDDKVGTTPVGDWAADYGMNSYSVGIEMVHVGGSGPYPEEQLAAVDALIAYIDAYYGFESAIIDHKAWRSGNSDTSPEFAEYLANYQSRRTHV